jgi:hypothetical protein
MPVIRISQQTWDRLKTYATPLEDTADDVVNIALDALEAARRKGLRIARHSTAASLPKRNSKRPTRGKRAPLKKLRAPLLETLYRLGGKAYSREIRKTIELLVAPILGKADYELVSNAVPRWWNAICSVRNDLIRQGLFRNDSERGIWELSKQGFELMRAQAEDRTARRPAGHSRFPREQGRIPRSYSSSKRPGS